MSSTEVVSGGDDAKMPQEHTVTIVVDDHKHKVRPGKWVVHDLKTAVGVDAAKVLAEITPHGLKDLEDNATIEVHEGQRFMSHVRSGGSS
jgi:hypothetical protein